jgi:hypothetical protein
MEYSKKQLAELVAGCFKTSNEPVFYANVNGTFYNSQQKARLTEEDQGKLIEFKNPNLAAEGEETAEPEKPTDLSKLTVEQLKAYAAEHSIDLGEATKKTDLLAAIAAAATQ